MTTLTVDTFRLAEQLERRGFDKEQARGVVEAIQSIQLENVASKKDVEIAALQTQNRVLQWMIPLFFGLYGLIVFKLF